MNAKSIISSIYCVVSQDASWRVFLMLGWPNRAERKNDVLSIRPCPDYVEVVLNVNDMTKLYVTFHAICLCILSSESHSVS